jgi:hypothetical protein
VDQNWYPDSRASHHITSDLANLNLKAKEYGGFDQIRVGNGTGLSIKHIGTAQISTLYFTFQLNNVLHVPQMRKNLLSVHQFTKATKTYFGKLMHKQ